MRENEKNNTENLQMDVKVVTIPALPKKAYGKRDYYSY